MKPKIKKRLTQIFKFLIIIVVILILLLLMLILIFKPTYKVTYKNKFIGYSNNFLNLEQEVYDSLLKGDNNASYYDLEEPIKFELLLTKRKLKLNYDIIGDIKKEAIPIYKYYSLYKGNERKYCFETYEEANSIIKELEKSNSDVKQLNIKVEYLKDKKEYGAKKIAKKELFKAITVPRTKSKSASVSYKGVSGAKPTLDLKFTTPLTGIITSPFTLSNRQVLGMNSPHSGIDIARPTGTPIRAAASGSVVIASYKGSYGNMIELDNGNEIVTVYGHLSRIAVSVGQRVKAGQVIGYVGSTGRSTGPHLHFEIRKNGIALNPAYYVNFK